MQVFARVIVLPYKKKYWVAWCQENPSVLSMGTQPQRAIDRLVYRTGMDVDTTKAIAIDSLVSGDHQIYLIPYRNRRRTLDASLN